MALRVLYAREFSDAPIGAILRDVEGLGGEDPVQDPYVGRLVEAAVAYRDWSKEQVTRRLKDWDYERVALIDRLILQMMIAEMVAIEEVPWKVSITEGVEIAKKYSTAESGAFVNGVLDSIYHAFELGELSATPAPSAG